MVITILGITGFQLYWLKENYDREKRALDIKTEVAFHETVQQIQVSKLRLDPMIADTAKKGKMKILISDGDKKEVKVRYMPKQEIVSTINVLRSKITDSLKKDPDSKGGMVIRVNKNSDMTMSGDTVKFVQALPPRGSNHILEMLYGVDSLQDSIRVEEIQTKYATALDELNIDVPFSIHRIEEPGDEFPDLKTVTVGFANPVTYKLELGNTAPYLLKRIGLPVLFSIVLLGITVLSFIMLYRSLLRQRRLAEVKNEFISNITHELKTPIATVGVAIEALKNFNAMQNPERTREYLDISGNELQRLNLLVDKVLKLSMFEKKEVELKYETMDLKNVVNEVVASMRLQLEKYKASILVSNSGNSVMGADMLHIQSVVFNLLDNALKYSKGDPEIKIEIEGKEKEIVLSVSDNGIGIPVEYQNKVFEKFFRIPHGNTHNAKGYGLGLSYVAHVVEKHRGTIRVESRAGVGSKFIITLPKRIS